MYSTSQQCRETVPSNTLQSYSLSNLNIFKSFKNLAVKSFFRYAAVDRTLINDNPSSQVPLHKELLVLQESYDTHVTHVKHISKMCSPIN